MKRTLAQVVLWAFFLAVLSSSSWSSEFYRGKTIRFVVGLSAGGGFDTYARLVARHFGKHVPGNPDTVVENMPGAGGLVLANHLYNKAKPDGLTVATFPGPTVLRDVLGYEGVKLDGRRLGWVIALARAAQACALTKTAGIGNMDQWLASKRPVKLGGLSAGSDTVDLPKVVRATTNLPIQVVTGYRGMSKARLAAESGEVDGVCFNWYGMKATWGHQIDAGNVRVVVQNVTEPVPDLKDVPLVARYAKNESARQLLQAALKAYAVPMYVYTVAPDTPADRLQTLRSAFLNTLRDPQLVEEAKRAKLNIDPIEGGELANIFTDLYEIDSGLITKIKEIVIPKR